jgi:hypothetical protein
MTNQPDPTVSEAIEPSIDNIARSSQKLARIFHRKPDWVQLTCVDTLGVRFLTRVKRAGGEFCFPIECLAFEKANDQTVAVRETHTDYLPQFCPERHINFDGTFCTGLRAGNFELKSEAIDAWWRKLEGFIGLQQTAHNTRKWSWKAAMRHGDAGDLQILGEEVSDQLGLKQAFDQALHHRRGELHDAKLLVRCRSNLLVNGRMECPCGRKNKTGRPYLRRECRKQDFDCPAKILAKIDVAEREFWESHRDRKCCGTMDLCPLKLLVIQPSSAMA